MTKLIEINSNNLFHITFPKQDDLINAVKQIPGRKWNSDGRFWTAPLSSWQYLDKLIEQHGFTRSDDVIDLLLRQTERRDLFSHLSESLTGEFHVEGLNGTLRKYQQVVVNYGVESKRVLLYLDMGTGKTPISLAIIQHLKAYPCIVVCPAVVKYKWKDEVEKWLPDNISCSVNNKSTCCTSDISVINYDNLNKFKEVIRSIPWGAIIIDESQFCKSEKSIRGKLVKEISENIPVRIALSGTPDPNRPKDLVHQLDILGRLDEVGGRWHFLNYFCNGFKDVFGWNFNGASNKEELRDKLQNSGAMIQRLKKDVMPELPSKTIEIITVDIDNRSQYNQAIREARKVKDNSSALRMISELRQIVARGKLGAVKEQVDGLLESGHKLVIFCHHVAIIDRIYSWYPDITIAIDGRDSAEKKNQKANQFQSSDKIRIVICSDEIGIGIELTAASYSVHVEWTWTDSQLNQNIDRLHRFGITNPVIAYIIHSDTGMDRAMKRIVEQKRSTSLSNLEKLKEIVG